MFTFCFSHNEWENCVNDIVGTFSLCMSFIILIWQQLSSPSLHWARTFNFALLPDGFFAVSRKKKRSSGENCASTSIGKQESRWRMSSSHRHTRYKTLRVKEADIREPETDSQPEGSLPLTQRLTMFWKRSAKRKMIMDLDCNISDIIYVHLLPPQ